VLTDDELVALIESLPSEGELLAELSALSKLPGALPERVCAYCERSIELLRRDAQYCSHACRQCAWEKRQRARRNWLDRNR
jgi:predicted nucleic acid-binding Zn ribbon protein